MPRSRRARRDEIRDKLILPVAITVLAMFIASGVSALWTGDVRVFGAVTLLMSGLCGFVFGIRISRAVANGNGG